MTIHILGAWFFWLLVFVYSILGAIDFGSSFWRWYYHLRGYVGAESVAATYLSPTWELINAFLIVIPVALVGLFPNAAFTYGTILALPATLLLILLALRGAYLQFGYASKRFQTHTLLVSGVTGLLLPGMFIALLPLSQGGYVQVAQGNDILRLGKFFSSVSVYLFMTFGIVLSLYISTLFLARYAQQAKEWRAYHRFVGGARWTGPLSLLLGIGAFLIPTPGGLHLIQNGLRNPFFEPFLMMSLIAFLLSYAGILTNKRGEEISNRRALWQLVFGVIQIVASQLAYAVAHAPYLLYPLVTINSSATNRLMFLSTLMVLFFGLVILSPLLLWFRRLFITDAEYVATHIREPH